MVERIVSDGIVRATAEQSEARKRSAPIATIARPRSPPGSFVYRANAIRTALRSARRAAGSRSRTAPGILPASPRRGSSTIEHPDWLVGAGGE